MPRFFLRELAVHHHRHQFHRNVVLISLLQRGIVVNAAAAAGTKPGCSGRKHRRSANLRERFVP
jgi:hypothetical protein